MEEHNSFNRSLSFDNDNICTGACIRVSTDIQVYVQLYVQVHGWMNVHVLRCPRTLSSPGAAQQSTRPAECLDSRGGRAGGGGTR